MSLSSILLNTSCKRKDRLKLVIYFLKEFLTLSHIYIYIYIYIYKSYINNIKRIKKQIRQ